MSRGDFKSGWSASYGSVSNIEAREDGCKTVVYNRTTHSGYQQEGEQEQDVFQEFSDSVSSTVFQINNNTTVLERILKQINNGKDNIPEEKIHQIQIATNTLASKTTAQLKHMSKLCGGSKIQSRQQRVQHERLKDEFREAVSRYYSIQNKVAEKEKFLVKSSWASLRSGGRVASESFIEKTSLVEEESRRNYARYFKNFKKNLYRQRRQEQEKLEEQIVYDEDLIRDREQRIRQIEGDILDINEIFRDLATMVYEQGDIVDSIEGNIDRAYTNVESGNVQLQKASAYQKKARKKMCFLLIILAVVAAIIGVVIYIAAK